MRAIVVIATLLVALFAPAAFAQSGISYGGGDGASFATAIVVQGAKNELDGVAAERVYVTRLHPDWREANSALLNKEGRAYDSNTYRAGDGSEHTLIFDVTSFFGKF
jgi:hypothetical protein